MIQGKQRHDPLDLMHDPLDVMHEGWIGRDLSQQNVIRSG